MLPLKRLLSTLSISMQNGVTNTLVVQNQESYVWDDPSILTKISKQAKVCT
jgi:hypothetical protein